MMSKRFLLPMHQSFNKKPKLDNTISNNNLPLNENDNWGDENDDEILLLASQACEQVYPNNDLSLLDYTMCMQPASTSTQIYEQNPPSTLQNTFKHPMAKIAGAISSMELKDRCNRISSPLHGISSNIKPTLAKTFTDDFIVNDEENKGQNCDNVYQQLRQLQEDNRKLKSDNGTLLEKNIAKTGEVSILRSQLKMCQVAVDEARLEKIKAQEKVQLDYSGKLSNVKGEMSDLKTQLDFKNLEIMSMKEHCKLLESSKVKLTQVMVRGGDLNMSQRHNINNSYVSNEPVKRNKVVTTGVQTESKAKFVKLNKRFYAAEHELKRVLPIILQDKTEQPNSILEFNEKLKKTQDYSQTNCRIYSTIHRIPMAPVLHKDRHKVKLSLLSMHQDLSYIASTLDSSNVLIETTYINVFRQIKIILNELLGHMQCISQRMTAAFLKEMDEKYIETSSVFQDIHVEALVHGKPLFIDEEAILARRATIILMYIINSQKSAQLWHTWEQKADKIATYEETNCNTIELLCKICKYFNNISCGVYFSGFLLSVTYLLEDIWTYLNTLDLYTKLLEMVNDIIKSRPMPVVICKVTGLLRRFSTHQPVLDKMCSCSTAGNLDLDYDQGVVLFKKGSCTLQVLLKQIETMIKALDKQRVIEQLVHTTQNLLGFFNNINTHNSNWFQDNTAKCDCKLVIMQVIVYALHVCANILLELPMTHDYNEDIEAICRCGLTILCQWNLHDTEFSTQLGDYEGYYQIFVESCAHLKDRIVLDLIQENMLMSLVNTLQSVYEDSDLPPTECQEVWIESFNKFTMAD